MRVRAQARLPNPPQQLAEPRGAGKIGPKDEGVHEKADQPLQLRPVPPRDGGAHDDVFLAAVAGQKDFVGGQQRHEQGRPLAPGQRRQRLCDGKRDHEPDLRPAMTGDERTRVVRGRSRTPGAPCSRPRQ